MDLIIGVKSFAMQCHDVNLNYRLLSSRIKRVLAVKMNYTLLAFKNPTI
jgi:hypothetical protein